MGAGRGQKLRNCNLFGTNSDVSWNTARQASRRTCVSSFGTTREMRRGRTHPWTRTALPSPAVYSASSHFGPFASHLPVQRANRASTFAFHLSHIPFSSHPALSGPHPALFPPYPVPSGPLPAPSAPFLVLTCLFTPASQRPQHAARPSSCPPQVSPRLSVLSCPPILSYTHPALSRPPHLSLVAS